MPSTSRIPSRADGIANREKLLDAAESYFAENGLDAPLQGIAESAGVGVGTLYRNFASHEELIEALFERLRGKFVEVEKFAAGQSSGWESLESFLRESVTFLVQNPAASEIMRRHANNAGSRPTRAWVEPLEAFVKQAQAEGSVRADLTGRDLSAAPLALGSLQNFAAADRIEIAARMVTLMLDGMRAHPHEATELPIGASSI